MGGQGRKKQAIAFAHEVLPITAFDVELKSLKTFHNAEVVTESDSFKIETLSEVRKREDDGGYRARQRCWVAAQFLLENDASDIENPYTVYYGCVNEIWQISVDYKRPSEQITHSTTMSAVRVDWQYGLIINRRTGIPSVRLHGSVRRGSQRDRRRSIEDIGCVNRLIGFLDHDGRRHFLDPRRFELRSGRNLKLEGTI
ncbi:hypothetical protein FGB62_362g02 [Gracilaria domingensis]|nr:hypothetical protein FGB62_362g02 [Gracilaria domingensis]